MIERNFIKKCKSELPKVIKSADKNYYLSAGRLEDGCLTIAYAYKESRVFNWKDKLCEKIYDPIISSSENNFDDIIADFNKILTKI